MVEIHISLSLWPPECHCGASKSRKSRAPEVAPFAFSHFVEAEVHGQITIKDIQTVEH